MNVDVNHLLMSIEPHYAAKGEPVPMHAKVPATWMDSSKHEGGKRLDEHFERPDLARILTQRYMAGMMRWFYLN